jgi:hypothetical protein
MKTECFIFIISRKKVAVPVPYNSKQRCFAVGMSVSGELLTFEFNGNAQSVTK